MLSPTRWIVVLAALLLAGWFVFDGTHALVLGEYVTPSSGRFAGQLGPWTRIVEMVGVEPRSRQMHLFFIAYGVAWLIVTPLYLFKAPFSRIVMLAFAVGGLWYLPFGTALCVLQIVLILLPKKVARA